MSTNKNNQATLDDESIRATIFGKHYVQIDRLDTQTPWTQEIHAINWFNTRSLPLYNFYNMIAGRSVTAVGGKPLFKGRLVKHLIGSDQDLRTVLLIVKYPSAVNFQTMLQNTYFKVVSVLRTAAVKQFTFCLTKRHDGDTEIAKGIQSYSYAVHHFRGSEKVIALAQDTVRDTSMELIFASVKTHQLKTVNANEDATPVPDVMDGVMVFRAVDSSVVENTVNSEQYQLLIKQTDSSFVGLLERLM